MKKRLIVVGGHGSGQIAMSVFEAANEHSGEWEIEGYLTDVGDPGQYLDSHRIRGGTEEVAEYVAKGYCVHYALHLNAKKKEQRVKLLRSIGIPDEALATAVHPSAHLESSTRIGRNVVVCANAAMSFGVTIGDHVHIYSGSLLGHDCVVDDFSTVAAHAVIGGRVRVGEGSHVGLNSTIREDVSIGNYAIVGMASAVLRDVEPYQIVAGNPARQIGVTSSEAGT